MLDAELNSASNGVTFEGGHRAKMGGFAANTEVFWPIPAVILADIRS